jgi:hypothetical protein
MRFEGELGRLGGSSTAPEQTSAVGRLERLVGRYDRALSTTIITKKTIIKQGKVAPASRDMQNKT